MVKSILNDVSILDILQQVVDHNNHHYQSDFEYDKQNFINAKVGDTFFWLSRRNGTWLYKERDVYMKTSSANHTWSYYGGSKSENVKAYMVEITGEENHKPMGTITELDYEKQLDYLVSNAVMPTHVELLFKNPNSVRIFAMSEYQQNTFEITRRYGTVDRTEYKVENEYDLLYRMEQFRNQAKENAISTDVETYFYDMEKTDFEQYGYSLEDKVFLNHNDAEGAIEHNLNVYAITKQGEETVVKTIDDFYENIENECIFCTNQEEKNFLKHLQTNPYPLFTEEENQLVFDCVIEAAKENKVYDLVTLDKVLYKLEHLLPKFSLDYEPEKSRDFEIENEQ